MGADPVNITLDHLHIDFGQHVMVFMTNDILGENMTRLKNLALGLLLVSAPTLAVTDLDQLSTADINYLTIAKRTVREITPPNTQRDFIDPFAQRTDPSVLQQANPIEQTGNVIKVARELVALGEDLYRLVVKGRPNNTTKYAPISVIPRISNQPVDLLETENWSMPVKRTYDVSWTNVYGVEVVYFRYSVFYSYNGSYDGRGRYLTSVQVLPEQVKTLWGYDFTATMKLGGIQNNGTRLNPIAAATVLIEYTIATVLKAENRVDTFFVTGNGGFRKY